MSDHAETALDQLRLADSCGNDRQLTRADEHLGYLAKAIVHALLEVAEQVRRTTVPPVFVRTDAPLAEGELADLAAEWCRKYGT